MQMSEAAKKALTGAAGYAQGTVVTCKIGGELDKELQASGLTGRNGGLTRKGSIEAERLQNKQLDELFG